MSLQRTQKIRVLVTLGPTRAFLDSVRYLSNYSTGELGSEIAKLLVKQGFEVAVIAGPVQFDLKKLGVKKIEQIVTVEEMLHATLSLCETFKPHYFLPAAAVLDFVPQKSQTGKVSSKKKYWKIKLIPTKKIIDEVQKKFPKIKKFGFKLEAASYSAEKNRLYAEKIMKKKKLEGLCLNFLNQISASQHPATLFFKDGSEITSVQVSSKTQIAQKIVQFLKRYPNND